MHSLHEATVQLAYLRSLRMKRVEEDDVGRGGSDFGEGRSAIVALEEAARRIAGSQREAEEDGAFDDTD